MSAAEPTAGVPEPAEGDIRPVVAKPQSRAPLYLFVAGMVVLAALLFSTLDARRRASEAPATSADAQDLARVAQAPPTLFVPPVMEGTDYPQAQFPIPARREGAPIRERPSGEGGVRFVQAPTRIYQPSPAPITFRQADQIAGEQRPAPGGQVLVVDVPTAGDATPAAAGQGAAAQAGIPSLPSRVRSGRLANPSTTVPQGTSIPAVLETALDSTRPGQARAIVSLDVRGFDGVKVLVPRGSRLYGEYQADMQRGQRRALIQWTRLLRPDGVTIAIGSPTADRLGRAGIGGKVNNHFFQQFFGAILQSSLDIGTAIASQSVGNASVVLVPQGLGQALPKPAQEIQPTLTVKQGRSIAVLVARDLDFASIGGR